MCDEEIVALPRRAVWGGRSWMAASKRLQKEEVKAEREHRRGEYKGEMGALNR